MNAYNPKLDGAKKIESAGLLILAMEQLMPKKWTPISRTAVLEAGSKQAALDRQKISASLTNLLHYSIVVELVVKYIWEQQYCKQAPRTHNVHRLFRKLTVEVRREVNDKYGACCVAYKESIQAGKAQHGQDVVAVEMADLDGALRWNADVVKDFKYEMKPRGLSVPAGMFWSTDRVWVMPSGTPNFAISLTRWASRRFPTNHVAEGS